MSHFGNKRKARVVRTLDFEDEDDAPSILGLEGPGQGETPTKPENIDRSKPLNPTTLRKSVSAVESHRRRDAEPFDTEDDAGAQSVSRPSVNRYGTTKDKKRMSGASRLSFGPSEGGIDAAQTPRKSLSQRALANSALRNNLPTRFLGGEDERPRYSKQYLEELQNSTPNTPQALPSASLPDEEMDLYHSELEGAMIVQSPDLSRPSPSTRPSTRILTESEIREKKDRRARLALQSDVIPLEGSDDDLESGSGLLRLELGKKKKQESRLMAEDEDLGEGYDEFVLDGKLALGKNAETEASRRHRQEMVDLIEAAEAGSDAESDDSEAERRAAYEAAQRRAGLDGLSRQEEEEDIDSRGGNDIPRIKPLPDLDEVLQRMQNLVQGIEDDVSKKRTFIKTLEAETRELVDREKEVQEILNKAGEKYQSVLGQGDSQLAKLATQSPLRTVVPGAPANFSTERGLESFGATPTTRSEMDVEMS